MCAFVGAARALCVLSVCSLCVAVCVCMPFVYLCVSWGVHILTQLVLFLQARPKVNALLLSSYQRFMELYRKSDASKGGLHSIPTMLCGSLETGSAYMLQGKFEPMAMKKAQNFTE